MTTSTSFAQMANNQSISLSSALRANTPPTKGQTTSRKFLTLSIFFLLSFFCTTNAWGEDTWTLVTNVSDLAVDDEVVIVAKDYNYALSTTQNNNNRGQASVTKSNNAITFGADVQVLTLEVGITSGTWAFYTGSSGYLYAASSGSNHLKTQTTNNANGSWNITIASTGVATIKATGTNSRNWLRYNSSNNPPIFSCYGSGQGDVCIYKKVTPVVPQTIDVTLHYNGIEETLSNKPSPYTLPTTGEYVEDACDGWEFAGWYGSEYAKSETKPTYITQLTSTGDAYAVYSKTETTDGGGGTTGSKTLVSSSSSTYYQSGYITGVSGNKSASWTADGFTMVQNQNSSSSTIALNYAEIRVYASHSLVFTPSTGSTITSIVVTANTSAYADALGGSSIGNCTKSVSGSIVTITPTDGTKAVTIANSAQSRLNKIVVNYTSSSGGSTTYYHSTPDCSTPSKTYSIKINPTINGNVSVNPKEAAAGTTITLNPSPGSGFKLATLTVTRDDNDQSVQVKNNQFTMPASNVTVTATFQAIQKLTTPTNLGADNITTTSATLTWEWNESTFEAQLQNYNVYIYDATGTNQLSGPVTATDKSLSTTKISGLTLSPGTTYKFKVVALSMNQAICLHSKESDWGTFTTSTPTQLDTPTNLQVTNITCIGATLSWGNVTNNNGYTLSIKNTSSSQTFNSTIAKNETSGTPPLNPGITYTWKVVAKGDGTNYNDSEVADGGSFTTNYKITYDVKGGSWTACADGCVAGGEDFTICSTVPTKTGYNFMGWSTADDQIAEYQAEETIENVSANITLYAVWEQKKYTVNWYVNGTSKREQTDVEGAALTDIPEPTTSDCDNSKVFVGWTTKPDYSHATDAPDGMITNTTGMTMPEGGEEYYAVFATAEGDGEIAELVKMTAYDDFNIGDKIVIIAEGTQYGLYQKTSTSNYIDYWTTQANDGVPTLAEIKNDSKRYVEVSAGTATGTIKLGDATNGYLYNSSSTDMSISTNNSSDWSIIAWTDNTFTFEAGQYLSCRTDLSSANKNKWRGAGASCNCETGNSCSGVIYYNIYKYTSGSAISYSGYVTTCDNTKATITYDLNGGTGATCEQQTVTKGDEFILCNQTPTKTGYNFVGWTDGVNTYNAGASTSVTDNTKFYAKWTAKTIIITWNQNYTGCPEPIEMQYVYDSDENTMPEEPVREGYQFVGWFTEETNGIEITEIGEENRPTDDVTYYAHWNELYSVTFMVSGQVYVVQEDKYINGDAIELPAEPSAANYACDGYVFDGWSAFEKPTEDANCPELVDANTLVENDLELHAVWKKASTSGAGTQIFYESFDTENGTGGNDGKWSGDIAKNNKVNTTWTFENEGGAYQCIKLGSGSKKGSATTPALTQLSGDAILSFKAAAWNSNSESTILKLSISGGGTLTQTSVTLVKGAWTTYEVTITDGTPSSTITFAAANASNNRFFLDEVKITTSGSYNYTTSPSCGPTMVAKENVWATSAAGQSVKVNVPLGIKLFEGNATITGTSTNENFVVNTLENAGNGEHQVVVVYTPSADDTKENTTITLTAKNGEEIWCTTTFTLNGRSLPDEFVIVAQYGDKWLALPANMTEANTYPGLEVEVTGNEVSAAPVSHLYTARAVHSTRFADNGTALRLVGNNDACLWASSAVSGTHIRNYAKEANATSANYEWNLYTEDGDTYYISSSAVTEEGRVLRLDGTTFGMYKQGVDAFRLLPVGCTSTPMNVKTSTTRISATISWNNAGACDLVIKLDETVVKNLPASVSPVVVSGLSESTAYTYTLTPVANASCAINGSFTTTGPTIDVVEWNAGGIRIYVDKDENVNPKVIINGEKEYGNVGGQLATELFFSKYYEAHAENKLLAVYNGTATTINLNGYVIKHGTVEIDLAQYGQTKGSIAPNEEIIFVSFDKDDTKSAESCAEKEEGFNTWNVLGTSDLAFSGRGSVGLYKNDVLIDLIGSIYPSGELTKIGKAGKPDYCGTEDDVQLHVDGVSVNDQSSFFCHNGDNIKTPEVETNYPISTNRCLLIRKNTVTSGATAVTSNKAEAGATCGDLSSTFTTLCTEWSGFRIGSGSSSDAEIQTATCEGLGYVGGFDYNNYYRTMETIYTGKTLDEYDYNEKDNTYFIEFEVPDYSCLNIQLQLTDNDGNVLSDQITQVPILVYDNKTTTNELFSAIVKDGENPDYENSKIRCATCDVVIQYGATLTKAAPGTANDVNQVRDIYVYPGGKLIIPEGADDYSVNSLSIRRDQDEVGAATIIAPLNITSSLDKPIYADVRINSENWHWLTLPYDCNIADVTWKNGSKAIYNSDWFLMTYDGEQRAATQEGGCWVSYEGTTIEAGKGYIIGITGHPTKSGVQYELRFPMAKEVLTKESDPAGKQVAVNAWGVKENIRPNHKGWNLVGNPYLDSYQPTTSGFKGLSLLKYTEVDPVTGEWYYDNSGTIPYLVTPINGGWYAYEQELASETKMKPLTAYFVQVGDPNNDDHENGEELYANFTPSSRANLPESIIRRAPSEVNETEEPVIVGVALTNSLGESDKTSLVIDDRFTNEYEMNGDFFKWFGDYYNYYTKPVLYTIGADQGKRAFNALNEELAKQPIPMGMYAAQAGNYTFSLNQQFDLSRVEEVWLYDATQSTYTNLMQSDYTFSTSKVNGAGRFSLSVKLAPKVATSIDNVIADKVWATTHTKQVIVNGLENGMHLWLYDATGKLLYNEPTSNYQHTYAVPQTGTYFVSVMNGNQKQTIKVVVE